MISCQWSKRTQCKRNNRSNIQKPHWTIWGMSSSHSIQRYWLKQTQSADREQQSITLKVIVDFLLLIAFNFTWRTTRIGLFFCPFSLALLPPPKQSAYVSRKGFWHDIEFLLWYENQHTNPPSCYTCHESYFSTFLAVACNFGFLSRFIIFMYSNKINVKSQTKIDRVVNKTQVFSYLKRATVRRRLYAIVLLAVH